MQDSKNLAPLEGRILLAELPGRAATSPSLSASSIPKSAMNLYFVPPRADFRHSSFPELDQMFEELLSWLKRGWV
jgi:predicted AlkP superfamily pyrophosphatase or phosphodiesterase